MKVFFILFFFIPFVSKAQLSTNQKKQVDALLAAQAKVFNKRIDSLITVLATKKQMDSLQVSLNPLDFDISKTKVVSIKKKS